MQLSRNFSLAEFIASETARAHGLSNEPTLEHLANLRLTAFGFEQARRILGDKAITITSGYRSAAVNKRVGGVPTSDHAMGFAGDFRVAGMLPKTAAVILRDSFLLFDQLILETSRAIIHLSFAPRLRREVLTQPQGAGTPFHPGIL